MPQSLFGLTNQFYVVAPGSAPEAAGYGSDTAELAKCHIDQEEIRCKGPDGGTCPDCGGQGFLLVETAWAFKAIREALGRPVTITCGYRCRMHQQRLWDAQRGTEAVAFPGHSPHEFAAALDTVPPSGHTPASWFDFIGQTLDNQCRRGLYSWGVHFDKGQDLSPNPVPSAYQAGVTW